MFTVCVCLWLFTVLSSTYIYIYIYFSPFFLNYHFNTFTSWNMIIGKHLEKLAKGHTISFHQKTDGLPNHFLFSGPNRRSMRMACFMKKMRYLEKNMRDGLAWSGSEVTDSAMKMCQKWLAHDLPFSRSRLVLLNLIGKRSFLDQRMITSLYNQLS